jgi:hypothetical protein
MRTTSSHRPYLSIVGLASAALAACTGHHVASIDGPTDTTSPVDSASACSVDADPGSGSPITHATYDFTNIHTLGTFGDTWDMAWADDGNLYSTYDDGAGFSNTRSNFGIAKLTGNATLTGDVYDVTGLTGTPLNSMVGQYGPMCGYPWWKTGGLTSVNGVLYLFASPDASEASTARQTGGAVSLVKSTDHGATWSTPPRQFAGDTSSNLNFDDGTVNQWTVALGPSGTTAVGFKSATVCGALHASHYAILGGQGTQITQTLSGLAANTHYRLMMRGWADAGSTIRVEATDPAGSFDVHADTGRTTAAYMDTMYLDFTTGTAGNVTIDVANLAGTTTGKVYAGFFQLLPSTFPGQNFGAPSFVKYGKDGAASVDGADQYVYAVSNNGYFSNGDYLILGRVPKMAISNLNDSDWQFYRGCVGADGSDDANWTSSITDASVTKLVAGPGTVGMVDITYIEPLKRYIMLDWGWLPHGTAKYFRQGTTVLDTYEAPHPWGPWTKIASVQSLDPKAFYDPHIINKFTTVDPSDPKKVHLLVATAGEWDRHIAPTQPYYKLTLVPLTISTD